MNAARTSFNHTPVDPSITSNMLFGDERLLTWIVVFPLLGAILNGLFGRYQESRKLIHYVGVGAAVIPFFLAVSCFVGLLRSDAPAIAYHVYQWFEIDVAGKTLPINIDFVFDHLSGLMTLVVTGIGSLIHIYATGYMEEEIPGQARFFAYLNLFLASMLILVLGSSLPVLFVGWEGVGLCSYLLIGFWYQNAEYAAAVKRRLSPIASADLGVIAGMLILAVYAGSFDFVEINNQASTLSYQPFQLASVPMLGISVATVATLCLFLGCSGKSAQIPLYVWLPDAMAGPTPVSALIHAATMVTAGVYLCCRMSPLFLAAPATLAVIAVIGAVTAFIAASIAVVQREMKKILAYSTVSQLGFMFAAVGVGAFSAAFFHVFTHAFFKACLFLGAGSVMHAVHAHGDADIFKLGGLKKYLPTTHWTFLVSCLAIAGIPVFAASFLKTSSWRGPRS